MKKYDLIVIGAGASGITAAITAARNGVKDIVVIEKKSKIGSKIAASGNGRCNMTNINADGYEECIEFFNSIGVLTRSEDEGRVYPYSEDAKDVVRALEMEAERLGVNIFTGIEVLSVYKIDEKNIFEVKCRKNVSSKAENIKEKKNKKTKKRDFSKEDEATIKSHNPLSSEPLNSGGSSCSMEFLDGGDDAEGTIRGKACLIACGGKAAPKLGTTGDGFRFAKGFGHSVSRLIPVLTAVELWWEPETLGLSGLRQKGKVSLKYQGETLIEEFGEIQFTATGLSGICIFNISRYMMIPEGKSLKDGFDDYEIVIDFMPEYTLNQVKENVENSRMSLCSIVKEPLAKVIREKLLSEESIPEQLKVMKFKPKGAKGWDFAQVTRGGVKLDEVDDSYMSKKCKGLFFSGEVLDFDAKCGGYNLTFAWISGMKSGEKIAEYIGENYV